MTALVIARRFWPVGAILLALLGLHLWGNSRYRAGVEHERAAWEQEAARLRAVAAQEAQRRQAAVDSANATLRRSRARIDGLTDALTATIGEHYDARPADDVLCLPADRVRASESAGRSLVDAAKAAD